MGGIGFVFLALHVALIGSLVTFVTIGYLAPKTRAKKAERFFTLNSETQNPESRR